MTDQRSLAEGVCARVGLLRGRRGLRPGSGHVLHGQRGAGGERRRGGEQQRDDDPLRHSTHFAMKRFISWLSGLARLLAHTRYLPSGLKTQKPSKPGAVVTRSRFWPSLPTSQRSKSKPFALTFDAKRMRLPSGVK